MGSANLDTLFRISRHALIRLWERSHLRADATKAPACDFWLVSHSKDWQSAILTIESIRRFSLNPIRTMFLVGNEPIRPHWLPSIVSYIYEGDLPVTQVAMELLEDVPFKGWILQQLLKYSGFRYSDRFVTVDCDTVLLKPHLFFTESGTVLRLAYEYSPHYRLFEKELNINGGRLFSFTCHMMPYKSDLIKRLLSKIEAVTGQNWATYVCNYAKQNGMTINEQDLYARYILESDEKISFRPWLNKTVEISEIRNIDSLRVSFNSRNSVSFHNNNDRELVLGPIAGRSR